MKSIKGHMLEPRRILKSDDHEAFLLKIRVKQDKLIAYQINNGLYI